MSQQGNDNQKKDLPNHDQKQPKNPIDDKKIREKGLEGTNEENLKEDAISGAAGQSVNSADEDKDHLENAMLQETHSSSLRAESQEKEKEYSQGHLEENTEKKEKNPKEEISRDTGASEKDVEEKSSKNFTSKKDKPAVEEALETKKEVVNASSEDKATSSEITKEKGFEENSPKNSTSEKDKRESKELSLSKKEITDESSEVETTSSEIPSEKSNEEKSLDDPTSEKDSPAIEETTDTDKVILDKSSEGKLPPTELPGKSSEPQLSQIKGENTKEKDDPKPIGKKLINAIDTPAEEPTDNPPQGPEKDEPGIKEDTPATPVKEPGSTPSRTEEPEEDEEQKIAEKKNVHSEFEDSVAEDSEDETTNERHGIEKKDYHSMSKEELLSELEKLVKKEKIQAIKEHVEEIRAEFNAKFDEELEEKKEEFLADGGNIIDFHYSTPLKKHFNSVYFDYKEKRNKYYQQLKQDLNKNLERRLEIIEELKGLLDVEENINTTYKHFKELQDRWKTAGPIPRDKYNTVWNTYHHHVENFYDFLHLNREFRDLDFKHNLEQKLKVIDRAEELTQEEDTGRAFRELQMLHKMWKEEIGPVAKEYREDIWAKFSEATKKIHDLRQAYYDQLDQEFEKNLETKQEIILKIKVLAETNYTSHNQWQQKIKEIESLRDEFFKAGKVPKEKNEETWGAFKQSVRQFNRNKNAYYKGLKKEQYENLEKKKELIKVAEEHKDSEDFKETTPLMKKIQMDWKKIGHVPRKDSDKVWKQFKAACNHYFDRLHKSTNEENSEEIKAFELKKVILDNLRSTELTGEKKNDLPVIKAAIEEWKQTGKVPYNKRFIEGKFNKLLDQLFAKLDVDNTKAEMMKYENKIHALNEADDEKKLRNEQYFLTKKVEETKAEIRQLENNLQFFANVDDDNPLVQEVHKNIQDHKDQLKVWKEKLQKIKSLY